MYTKSSRSSCNPCCRELRRFEWFRVALHQLNTEGQANVRVKTIDSIKFVGHVAVRL